MFSYCTTWVIGGVVGAVALYLMTRRKPSLEATFKGKKVLITGASSGIGESLALKLVSLGANVVLAARRVDRLEQVKAKCTQKNGAVQVHVLQADVGTKEDCKRMIQEAVNALGGLDVLILNAGIGCLLGAKEAVEHGKEDTYEQLMTINYFGCVWPTLYALEHLRNSSGTIIVNSSLAGIGWTPGRTAYSASKHALRGFFNSLRCEEQKIQITTVYPGFVLSEIHDKAIRKPGADLERATESFMTSEDAARIILEGTAGKARDYPLTTLGWVALYFQNLMGSYADKIAIKKAASAFKNWDESIKG